ncbi:MAG: PQQ-binding-like beta-propeller repeat protein [Pirellulaceae bacterium]
MPRSASTKVRSRWAVFILGLLVTSAAQRLYADWPQFRGPTGDGVVSGPPLPLTWSESEHVTWKVRVPGNGHSSPVIADGRVWLTTAVAQPLDKAEMDRRLALIKDPQGLELVGDLSLRAVCFDAATGKQIHDIELFSPDAPEPIHYTNTYASPTPVLHDGRVYAHFGTYGTAAIDAVTGEVQWRSSELHVDHQNGPGSSPIVSDNLLIAHYDGIDQQFIAALRLADGSLAWRTDRSGTMDPKPELQKAYCTPTLVESERGAELISSAANWVYGYSPTDGSELWKASYGDLGFSTVPRPIVGHGLAYVCTSFGKTQLIAVRYGGRGDVTDSHIAWRSDSQIPKKPSLALVKKQLLVCNDTGILTCLDALTGDQLWRERLGGNHAASPLISGELAYFFDAEGKTTVVRAGQEYEEVAVNQLDAGCQASPAVFEGALFIRTTEHLYRIE